MLLPLPFGSLAAVRSNLLKLIPAMSGEVAEKWLSKFHECAASGNVEELKKIVTGKFDLNARNDRGWTALMYAARNGQVGCIRTLLGKGVDATLLNSTGQTALDIATFWNHKEAIQELSNSPELKEQIVNYFAHHPLDKAAHRRKDGEWLEKSMQLPDTKYVLLSGLRPLALPSDHKGLYHLCLLNHKDVGRFLDTEPKPLSIFLGVEHSSQSEPKTAWFTLDVTGKIQDHDSEAKSLHPRAEFLGADYRRMMVLADTDAAVYAQARSLIDWHTRYKFCPTCGYHTVMEEAAYKRNCSNKDCSSLKGVHNTSYPRVDPVVIMLVVSADGKHCLLGRQKRFPAGMYSCLAGFMEPGESIEDACRREVYEESGISVDHVDYHSCQPWPFPSALMIGVIARASSNSIKVDKEELDDARWFARQDVIAMLTHQHADGLMVPPRQAIAHQLIKAWAKMSANL